MSEITFPVAQRHVITVRLEPNSMQGRDLAGQPALYLPLKLQLLPSGEQGNVRYTLVRLAGKLQNPLLNEFATFEVGPMAEDPNPTPFFRQQEAMVVLDRQRIKRFEEARAENDAHFQIALSALLWHPAKQEFEVTRPSGHLEVSVPKSYWAEKVISAWNLFNVKVLEIKFPSSPAGENFRNSYARVEEAEKQFASAQYKQVLTSLRLSFEGLAKSFGFESAGKDFFESLFISVHPDKKEKARDALSGIYRFLHLGPHELANDPNSNAQAVITRSDARFALTLAHAVFEYISPEA